MLVLATNSNTSLGAKRGKSDKVLGRWGANHVNNVVRDMWNFPPTHKLSVAMTKFCKKRFGAWQHPLRKLYHQIDHFIVHQKDQKRVQNALQARLGLVPASEWIAPSIPRVAAASPVQRWVATVHCRRRISRVHQRHSYFLF